MVEVNSFFEEEWPFAKIFYTTVLITEEKIHQEFKYGAKDVLNLQR